MMIIYTNIPKVMIMPGIRMKIIGKRTTMLDSNPFIDQVKINQF